MRTPKVNFWLKKNGKQQSEKSALIMLNFSYNSEHRLRMSTKLTIKANNWDIKKDYPKKSFADYSEFKSTLNELEETVLAGYRFYIGQGIIPKPSTLKQYILGRNSLTRETDIKTVHTCYAEFLEAKKPEVKQLTYAKYVTLQRILKSYEEKYMCKLTFENMDLEFSTKFKYYLNKEKSNNNNAASKTIDCIKVFLKWARKKGYHNELFYTEFKSKREKTEVVYLNLSELKMLLNLKLSKGTKLERTRNWFCFQCLTGQRFSDIDGLRWEHLIEGSKGFIWHLYQRKGNKQEKVLIPITKIASEILENQNKEKSKVFGKISNQKLNANIKELCELAGIDSYIHKISYSGKDAVDESGPKYEHISSHTARKTFVNIAYYELGMDKEAIRAITGHATDKQLNIYLGLDRNFAFEQMTKWDSI